MGHVLPGWSRLVAGFGVDILRWESQLESELLKIHRLLSPGLGINDPQLLIW